MLMLLRWRHIGKMLLVALLVMSCTSCTRWREAKVVVKEADRLLVYGNIIEDRTTSFVKSLKNLVL